MSQGGNAPKNDRSQSEQAVEDVRVVIADSETMTDVVHALNEQGIHAFGDYRNDTEQVLLRDALSDGIEYVVFVPLFDRLGVKNLFAASILDYVVRVYIRQEHELRTVPVGALIQLVQQRRNLRKH